MTPQSSEAKIEFRSFGKRVGITVSRKKRDAVINAALGDQSVSEPRFAALCENLHPQSAGAFPVTGLDSNQRHC